MSPPGAPERPLTGSPRDDQSRRTVDSIASPRAGSRQRQELGRGLRCLKHRIARPVFRLLRSGQSEWALAA
jgi:hypothetical protein